jgi:hypothetical protein
VAAPVQPDGDQFSMALIRLGASYPCLLDEYGADDPYPTWPWRSGRIGSGRAWRHSPAAARLADRFENLSFAAFQYALWRCGLTKDDVRFVGNQLNTEIAGGEAFGIRTVWLCACLPKPSTMRREATIRTLHR